MKHKLILLLSLFVVLAAATTLVFTFVVNPVTDTTTRAGTYFNESGAMLGHCTIQTEVRKLDTGPGTATTYYYNSDQKQIGYCEGNTTGSFINLNKQPAICTPASLQTSCDTAEHPAGTGYCARAKYSCVLGK